MSTLIHLDNDAVIAQHIVIADNFLSRFKGLMFTRQLAHKSGLLIKPCQQIHTHFMRYDLDIIFVDNTNRVVHIEHRLRPWRISKYVKKAAYVVELNAGEAERLKVGDTLQLVTNSSLNKH